MFTRQPLLSAARPLFKAKRPWPPDFTLLSQREQFRLERIYRRRAKLKMARPQLQKTVTLAQWGVCSFVAVYGVFWMDWGEEQTKSFAPVREWAKGVLGGFWSRPQTAGLEFQESPRDPGKRIG